MTTYDTNIPRTAGGWVAALLATLVIIVLLPPVLLFLAIRTAFYSLVLVGLWIAWLPQGKDLLLIYSNSPYWQGYFETKFLPSLEARSLTLNWSERKKWSYLSLRRLAFDGFAGEREFNPLAIVFKPFRWPKRFRFYQEFRDLKHGNEKPICAVVDRLAATLDSPIPYPDFDPRPSV
ncbi:MAG: hypothetical protein ACR2NM_00195 [Bythopirellula sp.]